MLLNQVQSLLERGQGSKSFDSARANRRRACMSCDFYPSSTCVSRELASWCVLSEMLSRLRNSFPSSGSSVSLALVAAWPVCMLQEFGLFDVVFSGCSLGEVSLRSIYRSSHLPPGMKSCHQIAPTNFLFQQTVSLKCAQD